MIWECSTKNDIIDLFKEAKKPLDKEILLDLAKVDNDLKSDGLDRSFVLLDGQCRICNHKQLLICPAVCDLDNLECANCENMTVQERDIPEWEE